MGGVKVYLLFFLHLVSCINVENREQTRSSRKIYVFKLDHQKKSSNLITGLMMEGDVVTTLYLDSLYFRPTTSVTRIVKDSRTVLFLRSISSDNLKLLNTSMKCDCVDRTTSEYVIKIVEGEDVQEFKFKEIYGCPPRSQCSFFDQLRDCFIRLPS